MPISSFIQKSKQYSLLNFSVRWACWNSSALLLYGRLNKNSFMLFHAQLATIRAFEIALGHGPLPFVSAPRQTNKRNHGHSGRLSKLLGCSPSASVFKYLLPN